MRSDRTKKLATVLAFAAAMQGFSLSVWFDATKAPDRPLFLYRHNGTAWVRVGTAAPNDEHLISTASALSPLDSGTMNIGFFAVVVPKSGTMVLFR